uniref:DUF541 domain-containing protein n=1 Tax=Chlorobium chlorochromatii (strain CaD3) TaxID=340177 RepID=Q3APN3_CHLCH
MGTLLLIGFATIAPTTQSIAADNHIAVSASASIPVKPDMAEFTVIISADAKQADKAATEVAEKYAAVQASLRKAGIAADDAPTTAYTVAPRWEWNGTLQKNVLKGYSARHTLKVKVRSLSAIGQAVDAAVQAGANEVQEVHFVVSRYEAFRQQALEQAVAKARADAAIMAQAADCKLGTLLEASVTQQSNMPRPMYDAMTLRVAAAPKAETTMVAAEQEVEVTVHSRWQIRPLVGSK